MSVTNKFITPTIVAREAIALLTTNRVFQGLVHTVSDTFTRGVGETISIRKLDNPTVYKKGSNDTLAQNVTEDYVSVTLDQHAYIKKELTGKQMALSIEDFTKQIIQPSVIALLEDIDLSLANLYKDIPYYQAVSATKDIGDITAIGAMLTNAKCPFTNRSLVMNPTTAGGYKAISDIFRADARGNAETATSGFIGTLAGFDTYENQSLGIHYNGDMTSMGNVSGTKGDATLSSSGATASKTITKGTLFTISGDTTVYTVTADTQSNGSGAIDSLPIYPTLQKTVSAGAATQIPGAPQSLAFHKNAFCFATAPLSTVNDDTVANISYDGINIRTAIQYDPATLGHVVVFDMLYGVKTLTPELAVRLVG